MRLIVSDRARLRDGLARRPIDDPDAIDPVERAQMRSVFDADDVSTARFGGMPYQPLDPP